MNLVNSRRGRLSIAATMAIGGGVLAIRRLAGTRTREEAARLADILRLTTGSRVADVGAGGGSYTIELARRVGPAGHVFATEVDQSG